MNSSESLLAVAEDSLRIAVDPPKGVPLPWWPDLNSALGGLRAHELTLITAPTGAGKTQLNACISVQLMQLGIPHFVASIETGRHDYFLRMASALQAIDFNSGDPVNPEICSEFIKRHGEILRQNNVWFSKCDDRVEVEELVKHLHREVSDHGIKVAILDNLNFFLKVTSSHMEKAEMDQAIHTFVMLVKKLPIHVILIVHPKKTDHGRVESEFDIKGSSTAVQEASNVLLFNRIKKEMLSNGFYSATDRELTISKLRRRGKYVGKRFYFSFNNGRYIELDKRETDSL